jgi:para-nitrobenzyl esterase
MRRATVSRGAALLVLIGGACALPAAPIARTSLGNLAGISQGATNAFLGIRYAAPPTGALRWRSPQPLAAWSGLRSARAFGHSCWQALSPQGFRAWTHEYGVQGDISEDCLFLNIWAPAKARGRLPVLVWIHGGAFTSGSGAVPIYDGRALARRGIVVVTINYRVGIFGFLAHPDLTREAGRGPNANFGLQDMIAALKWVHANVAAFHGDPAAVTIAGQSAGAMAVHALVASPLTRGLFARAIGESGLPDPATPPVARAEADGAAFARAKGAGSIATLRRMSAEALATSQSGNAIAFGPVIDGVLLPGVAPASHVPMLVGFNADEDSAMGDAYGSRDPAALGRLLGRLYGAAARRFAPFYPIGTDAERAESDKQARRDSLFGALYWWRQRHGERAPVFAYLWDHIEPGPQSDRWLAFHSSEIPYVFQTFGASPERAFTAADRALSDRISAYWLNFIKRGDPNGRGLPHWPALETHAPMMLRIANRTASEPLLPPERLAALKALIAEGGRPDVF